MILLMTVGCSHDCQSIGPGPTPAAAPAETVASEAAITPLASGTSSILDIAVLGDWVCVIAHDRSLWCSIGGGALNELRMRRIDASREHARVAVPRQEVCTCDTDGLVRCWTELGRVDGPVESDVPELEGCTEISGRYPFLCALRQDGTMACVDEFARGRHVAAPAPVCTPGLSVGNEYACISSSCGGSGCWSLGSGRRGGPHGTAFARLRATLDNDRDFTPVASAHVAGGVPYRCAIVGDGVACSGQGWGTRRTAYLATDDGSALAVRVPGEHLVDVQVADTYVFAITESGDVYRWGCLETEVRCADRESRHTPTLVAVDTTMARGGSRGEVCFVDRSSHLVCQGPPPSGRYRSIDLATMVASVLGRN